MISFVLQFFYFIVKVLCHIKNTRGAVHARRCNMSHLAQEKLKVFFGNFIFLLYMV